MPIPVVNYPDLPVSDSEMFAPFLTRNYELLFLIIGCGSRVIPLFCRWSRRSDKRGWNSEIYIALEDCEKWHLAKEMYRRERGWILSCKWFAEIFFLKINIRSLQVSFEEKFFMKGDENEILKVSQDFLFEFELSVAAFFASKQVFQVFSIR